MTELSVMELSATVRRIEKRRLTASEKREALSCAAELLFHLNRDSADLGPRTAALITGSHELASLASWNAVHYARKRREAA